MSKPKDSKPKTAIQKQRNKDGTFAKGCSGGPGGNHFLGMQQKLRSYLFDKISQSDWTAVRKALVDKAKDGDLKALEMLLNYTIGKPKESIDLDVTSSQFNVDEARTRIMAFFRIDKVEEDLERDIIDAEDFKASS